MPNYPSIRYNEDFLAHVIEGLTEVVYPHMRPMVEKAAADVRDAGVRLTTIRDIVEQWRCGRIDADRAMMAVRLALNTEDTAFARVLPDLIVPRRLELYPEEEAEA